MQPHQSLQNFHRFSSDSEKSVGLSSELRSCSPGLSRACPGSPYVVQTPITPAGPSVVVVFDRVALLVVLVVSLGLPEGRERFDLHLDRGFRHAQLNSRCRLAGKGLILLALPLGEDHRPIQGAHYRRGRRKHCARPDRRQCQKIVQCRVQLHACG